MMAHPLFAHSSRGLLFVAALALFTTPAAADDGPLFRFEGFDYFADDLPVAQRQLLYEAAQQHYQSIQSVADEALFDVHVSREAKRTGANEDEVRESLLAVDPPSESAIEAFYKANEARIPAPLDQVRDRISLFLSEQAIQARKKVLVDEIKSGHEFELLARAPVPPRVEIDTRGYPFKGAADAPVTVVEFSDFQCPHCKQASAVLRTLADRYGDRIRFVYKDFPVNRSGVSRLVARGAACADEQGRFWDYHDLAFETQSELSNDSPAALASTLGLDLESFDRCYQDAASADKVARSEQEAHRLGLSGTPTLFVNGRRLVIEDLEQDVSQAIERALDRQG